MQALVVCISFLTVPKVFPGVSQILQSKQMGSSRGGIVEAVESLASASDRIGTRHWLCYARAEQADIGKPSGHSQSLSFLYCKMEMLVLQSYADCPIGAHKWLDVAVPGLKLVCKFVHTGTHKHLLNKYLTFLIKNNFLNNFCFEQPYDLTEFPRGKSRRKPCLSRISSYYLFSSFLLLFEDPTISYHFPSA